LKTNCSRLKQIVIETYNMVGKALRFTAGQISNLRYYINIQSRIAILRARNYFNRPTWTRERSEVVPVQTWQHV